VVKSRFPSLDGLRGIAALVVVLHHGAISHDYALYSGLAADSRFDGDLALSGMPFLLLAAGDFAVSMFLVLSGFVLAHSYLHSTLGAVGAVVKRYARLTIPIAATSLLSLAAAAATPGFALPGAGGSGRSPADLLAALRTCLMEAFYGSTIGGIHEPSYNGVLWTIPIEFQGSLLLIALFAVARFAVTKAGSKPERVVDFAGAGALLLLLATWHSRLGLFGAGATLYWLFGPHRPPRRDLANWTARAILILALFLGTMPDSPQRIEAYDALIRLLGFSPETAATQTLVHPLASLFGWKDPVFHRVTPIGLWHGIGAVLLLFGTLRDVSWRGFLERPSCLWLGEVSFPLYLIHSTVYRVVGLPTHGMLVGSGFGYGTSSLVAITVYTAASLLAAHVLARSVEKAAVRWADETGRTVDRWGGAARGRAGI
jgi:peptidoglycan/LPS O-acetylase OafA/YrhL